jgi:hypothetical protein
MTAGLAQGATIRYAGSGDYFTLSADQSSPPGWQSSVLPGSSDTIRFNWGNNTVTLAGTAPSVSQFQMGVDESGGLVVNSGGVLSATGAGTSAVGHNGTVTGFLTVNSGGLVTVAAPLEVGAGGSGTVGNLTINGGTVTLSSHLWVGDQSGAVGSININSGGVLNIGGMLGLGTINSTSASGGTGTLNVNDGGILNLGNIQASGLGSVQPGSLLDIYGSGEVTIHGDFTSVMNGYIAAGRIEGNNVVGNAQAVYNSGLGETLLTVIPEPSTFALMALMGAGLVVRRLVRRG